MGHKAAILSVIFLIILMTQSIPTTSSSFKNDIDDESIKQNNKLRGRLVNLRHDHDHKRLTIYEEEKISEVQVDKESQQFKQQLSGYDNDNGDEILELNAKAYEQETFNKDDEVVPLTKAESDIWNY